MNNHRKYFFHNDKHFKPQQRQQQEKATFDEKIFKSLFHEFYKSGHCSGRIQIPLCKTYPSLQKHPITQTSTHICGSGFSQVGGQRDPQPL